MTVIRPNSISGINSITANGGDINIFRSNGAAGDLIINNIVGAAATFTGVLSYEDVTNVDSVGLITARGGIRIGAGTTVGPVSGIVTYFGDGSQLTGIVSDKIFEGNTEAEVVDTGSDGHFKVTTEGSERLRITGAGKVGIGTDNPVGGASSGMFEIYNSAHAKNRVAITVNEAQNNAGRIDFKAATGSFSSTNVQASVEGIITNSSGALTGDLVFHTNAGDSLTEKLRISSTGIVTKPNTPAFHVSRTSGDVSSNNYVVFNTVSYNNGSHYDNSDGKFTAPVTGIYFFSAWHFTGGTSAFGLRINGSQFGEYAWDDTGGCATWVCPMTVNQYAQIYTQGYTWRGTASYHNGFCGYLIG